MKNLIRHTNKYFLNPIMMKIIAPHWVFAIVHHVGRKSKKKYENPIIAIPRDYGFLLALTYGDQVDWYKNVLAAGSCEIEQHGKIYKITKIESINDINMYKQFPKPLNLVLKLMNIHYYVQMYYED